MNYLPYFYQLTLEAVDGQQSLRCQCRAHAVFREPVWVYVQAAQHLKHGGENQSVAFQFYDDQRPHVILPVVHQIVEREPRVNGETLGFGPVDQCDA